MKPSELKRTTALQSDPAKDQAFVDRGRSNSSMAKTRGPMAPLSAAQKRKVAESSHALIALGRTVTLDYFSNDHGDEVDGMHLTPRSKGGCDHPDCIVAAARLSVHRPYDEGELDLLKFFSAEHNQLHFQRELQHMLEHLTPVQMVEQLANDRVLWRKAMA